MRSHEIIYTIQEFGAKNAMESQPHVLQESPRLQVAAATGVNPG